MLLPSKDVLTGSSGPFSVQVTRHLSARFQPSPQLIKQRIEKLIEREPLGMGVAGETHGFTLFDRLLFMVFHFLVCKVFHCVCLVFAGFRMLSRRKNRDLKLSAKPFGA